MGLGIKICASAHAPIRAGVDARERKALLSRSTLRFEARGWGAMTENTFCDTSVSDPGAVASLKMLLDYAIAEGRELRLPVFVLLLRMAGLELAKSDRHEFHHAPDCAPVHDDERVAL
jgi:hypothetical protein